MKFTLVCFLQILSFCSSEIANDREYLSNPFFYPRRLPSYVQEKEEQPNRMELRRLNLDDKMDNYLQEKEEEEGSFPKTVYNTYPYPLATVEDEESRESSVRSGGFPKKTSTDNVVQSMIKMAIPVVVKFFENLWPPLAQFLADNGNFIAKAIYFLIKLSSQWVSKVFTSMNSVGGPIVNTLKSGLHKSGLFKRGLNSIGTPPSELRKMSFFDENFRGKRQLSGDMSTKPANPGFVKSIAKSFLSLNHKFAQANQDFIARVDKIEGFVGFVVYFIEGLIRILSYFLKGPFPSLSKLFNFILTVFDTIRGIVSPLRQMKNMVNGVVNGVAQSFKQSLNGGGANY